MSVESDLIAKLTAFVDARFGGDWRVCWQNYADDQQELDREALKVLLKNADVGDSTWVRSMIGKEVIRRLDTNGNGKIGLDEFEAALERGK